MPINRYGNFDYLGDVLIVDRETESNKYHIKQVSSKRTVPKLSHKNIAVSITCNFWIDENQISKSFENILDMTTPRPAHAKENCYIQNTKSTEQNKLFNAIVIKNNNKHCLTR